MNHRELKKYIINLELDSKRTDFFNLKRYFISPSCPEKTVERETTKTAYVILYNSIYAIECSVYLFVITMLSGAYVTQSS